MVNENVFIEDDKEDLRPFEDDPSDEEGEGDGTMEEAWANKWCAVLDGNNL